MHSKQLNQDVGLTMPQLLSLKAVGAFEEAGESEITITRLSVAVQLSDATVSRVVDRLVRAGFVSRVRSEVDRRRLSLTLTDKGWAQYNSLPNSLQDNFVRNWNEIPGAEQIQLVYALRRIVQLMEADAVDAAPMLTAEDDMREAQNRHGPGGQGKS